MATDVTSGAHQDDPGMPVVESFTSDSAKNCNGLRKEPATETEGNNKSEMGTKSIKQKADSLPIVIPATPLSKPQFQCSICQAVFSKRWNCLSHMRAHTRVRPILNCPSCGKRCSKQSELDIHVRIHTGEKPYCCSVCQRRFVRQGQLNSHMRSHTGVKPYLCFDCGTAFASGSNLKRHQLLHAKGRAGKESGEHKIFKSEIGDEERQIGISDLSSAETGTNERDAPIVRIYTSQNLKAVNNSDQSDKVSLQTSIATNTGYDFISKRISVKGGDQFSTGSAAQFISQPIKPIPAMVPPKQVIIVSPNIAEVLEGKVDVPDTTPLKEEPDDKKHVVMETVALSHHDYSQGSDTAASWLAEAAQPDGQLVFTESAVSESSNEALSNVMQVDWSFLLEEAGLQAQGQPAENTENLPEQLSQTILPPSAASAISSTAFHLTGSGTPVNTTSYQISALPTENASSVQLGIPTDGSSAFQLGSPVSESNSTLLQMNGSSVPIVVSIPHLPAVALNSAQQDAGQVIELTQLNSEAETKAAPVMVVLEQLFNGQPSQEESSTADSNVGQFSVESKAFPQQGTVTILSPVTQTSKNNNNNQNNGFQTESTPITGKKVQSKNFVCDICSRSFSRQWYLTVHRNAHFRQKTFPCDVCSAIFSRVGNLNRHKQMHTGAKPFHCEQCPSKFASRYRLIEHERRHEGLKPYECEVCHSCFTDCSSLRRHQVAHKGDNLQHTCDVCGAGFRTMHSLTFHLRTHTVDDSSGSADQGIIFDQTALTLSDLPIVSVQSLQVDKAGTNQPCVLKFTNKEGHCQYICNLCSKSFPFSAACRQHILCHTDSRPFSCTDCGAKFSRKACAKRHVHVHRRAKRHQCPKCGQKFQTRPRLTVHSDEHQPPEALTIPCDECSLKFSKKRLVILHKGICHRRHLLKYKHSDQSNSIVLQNQEGEAGNSALNEQKHNEGREGCRHKLKLEANVTENGTAGKESEENRVNKHDAGLDSDNLSYHDLDTELQNLHSECDSAPHKKAESKREKDSVSIQPHSDNTTSIVKNSKSKKRKRDLLISPTNSSQFYAKETHSISQTSVPTVQSSMENVSRRPQRTAARNQREFLASLLLKRKPRT